MMTTEEQRAAEAFERLAAQPRIPVVRVPLPGQNQDGVIIPTVGEYRQPGTCHRTGVGWIVQLIGGDALAYANARTLAAAGWRVD